MRGFGFNLAEFGSDRDVALFYPDRSPALHREINDAITVEIQSRGGRVERTVQAVLPDYNLKGPTELSAIADRGYYRLDPPGTVTLEGRTILPVGFSPRIIDRATQTAHD